MSASSATSLSPAKRYIRIGEDNQPWITGFRCPDCASVAIDQTMACRQCFSRNAAIEFRASETGRVHTFTEVRRSYPGVAVPFLSVVVDLDDGLCLKGTLCEASLDTVKAGMRVQMIFDDAGGASDAKGNPYVGYHFLPLSGAEQ
ncbi:Zn-ribbon domain-containing OB-fold protein [Zhongshania sp.]|uniref:Zn-ribbon domain-containing OB-fold protein n=1 Tax=Zhongshania sp. TaxID=1971902 RepID=UPI003566D7F4